MAKTPNVEPDMTNRYTMTNAYGDRTRPRVSRRWRIGSSIGSGRVACSSPVDACEPNRRDACRACPSRSGAGTVCPSLVAPDLPTRRTPRVRDRPRPSPGPTIRTPRGRRARGVAVRVPHPAPRLGLAPAPAARGRRVPGSDLGLGALGLGFMSIRSACESKSTLSTTESRDVHYARPSPPPHQSAAIGIAAARTCRFGSTGASTVPSTRLVPSPLNHESWTRERGGL